MNTPGVNARAVILGVLVALVCGAAAGAQRLRTHTDARKGFRVKMLRWVKQVPTQPLEEQILAKWSGVKKPRGAKGRSSGKKRKNGKRPVFPKLELWVVSIHKKGPTTKGGHSAQKMQKAKNLSEQTRRMLNSGTDVKSFLKRRLDRRLIQRLSKVERPKALKGPEQEPFEIQEARINRGLLPLRSYFVELPSEFFGLVVIGASSAGIPEEMSDDIDAVARSLRRMAVRKPLAVTDPYKGSKLAMVAKRRAVRADLERGWSAYDTENFILISDMVSNTENRRLLREMLTELEVVRSEYEKAFPPQQEITAVSTVRVCNSYAGYQRYSKKPGTGGYWHPVAEELVLFNPSKTHKKADWMKRVTPKAILYHEAMHQYFHYANGSVPPASWFNEGYGEYFGGARIDRFQKKIRVIDKNAFRWGVVKKHREQNRWPKLRPMLKMTQRQFYSRNVVSQNYAFGWAFCYFLELERQKRPKDRNQEWAAIPQNYIKNLRIAAAHYRDQLPANAPKGSILRLAVPIQKDAYKRTFANMDLEKLEAAWIEAIKKW